MTIHVRDFREMDREALLALWEACKLTRPWNDPDADIDRAVNANGATILVGYLGEQLTASVMAGHEGHRG